MGFCKIITLEELVEFAQWCAERARTYSELSPSALVSYMMTLDAATHAACVLKYSENKDAEIKGAAMRAARCAREAAEEACFSTLIRDIEKQVQTSWLRHKCQSCECEHNTYCGPE